MDITGLVKGRVADVAAYHVEPYPCPVVLDANESPLSAAKGADGTVVGGDGWHRAQPVSGDGLLTAQGCYCQKRQV